MGAGLDGRRGQRGRRGGEPKKEGLGGGLGYKPLDALGGEPLEAEPKTLEGFGPGSLEDCWAASALGLGPSRAAAPPNLREEPHR
jgi:hypothetical protein